MPPQLRRHSGVCQGQQHTRLHAQSAQTGTRAGRRDSLGNHQDKGLSRASAQWIEEAHFTPASVEALKLAFGATKVLFFLLSPFL